MSEELQASELNNNKPISPGAEDVELILSTDKKKKLHEKLLAYYKEAQTKLKPWREEMEIDRGFYENQHWTDHERRTFLAQKRPVVTINEIKTTIDTILGMESKNRMETKVFPRNDNDISAANARTAWIKYLFDQNDGEFVIAEAFKAACTYGFGVVELGTQDRPGREPIYLKAIKPDEFFFDPYHKMPDLDDAEYCGIDKQLEIQKIVELFPQHAEKIKKETNDAFDEFKRPTHHTKKAGDQYKDFYDFGKAPYGQAPTRKQLKVIQMQYKVRQDGYILTDELGDQFVIDENLISDPVLLAKLETPGVSVEKKRITVIRQAVFTHETLLDDRPLLFRHGQFSYAVLWSERYHTGEPASPIRPLRDPQREVNRRRASAMLEITANQWVIRGAHNGNLDNVTKQLGDPFALIQEPIGTRLERIDRDSKSPANFNYYKEARNTIKELSGVNDELRGTGGEYQSGYAIGLRQQQGTMVISTLFDNLRRFRKQVGYQLLSMIDQFMHPGKKQRIVEKSNVDYELQYENKLMFFDIIVEEVPMIATDRQSQLMSLGQVMSSLPPEVQAQLLPTWLSLYDLPQMEEMVTAAKRLADVMVANLEAQGQQAQGPPQGAPPPAPEGAPPPQGPPPPSTASLNPNANSAPPSQATPIPPELEASLNEFRQYLTENGRQDLAELPNEALIEVLKQYGLL